MGGFLTTDRQRWKGVEVFYRTNPVSSMGLLLAHQLPGSQVDAAAAAGIKTILFLTVSALLVRYGRAPAGVNDPRSRTGPEQVSAEFGTFFPCPAPRPLRSMPECFPLDLTGVKHARCKWRSNHKDGRIGSATGDRGAEEFPFPTRDIAAARPPCPALETRGR
jgi:hypothetical protein